MNEWPAFTLHLLAIPVGVGGLALLLLPSQGPQARAMGLVLLCAAVLVLWWKGRR